MLARLFLLTVILFCLELGLFLLVLLMVFAVYNDLARIDFFHFFK